MSRRPPVVACEHHVDTDGTQHPGCGAEVVFVLSIPLHLRAGQPRKHIPLNATFDPADGYAPSHAVSLGGTTCRPLSPGETPGPSETPALHHYVTCPYRTRSLQ